MAAAASTPSDFLVVSGGTDQHYIDFNSIEALSSGASSSWAPLLDNKTLVFSMGHHFTCVIDSKLFQVSGGDGSRFLDLKCKEQKEEPWTRLPNLCGDDAWFSHPYNICGQIGNQLIACGGKATDGPRPRELKSAVLFDIAANKWQPLADMIDRRYSACGCASRDGKSFFVFGGQGEDNALTACERYDMASNTWTAIAPLKNRLIDHCCCLLPDGKILVCGGMNTQNFAAVADVQVYDPATNAWTDCTPMPEPRLGHTCTLFQGMVYVCGGQGAGSKALASCIRMDPSVAPEHWAWTAAPDLKTPRYYHSATVIPASAL